MSPPAWSNAKPCAECDRLMSADDAHRRCQRCRHAGKWRVVPLRLTDEQRARYNAQRRAAYREMRDG